MLLELRVANLALAADVTVPLGPGLTVLTGETGAGKSLIAGALALLCGAAADKSLVRAGEDGAVVEGLFDLSRRETVLTDLRRLGVAPADDGILVLRREVRRQGRGRVMINGAISSLSLLERVGGRLLTVQSQDQQRELSDPDFLRRLLDNHLGLDAEVGAVAENLTEFRAREADLAALRGEADLAREQLDLWRYQHEELDRAGLDPDEREHLGEQLLLLRHASALQEGAAKALQALSAGEPSARELLAAAAAALGPLLEKSRQLADAAEEITVAADTAASAAAALDRFLDRLELDPRRRDELEARQAYYTELERKYRRDVDELIALRDELAARLQRQDDRDGELAALESQCEDARQRLTVAAQTLHDRRTAGADGLARAARDVIRRLALPALDLEVAVRSDEAADGPITVSGVRCRVAGHGADRVRMRVRTNPGESRGEVGAIASGGERSRIHLGLTALARDDDDPPLLLLDEIDAGLGMDNAAPVAELLRGLADAGQVVCITHLPTMAVYGAAHLTVDKTVTEGRTALRVRGVTGEERVAEIARLLGGEGYAGGDGAAQQSYARELLARGGGRAARYGAAGEPA